MHKVEFLIVLMLMALVAIGLYGYIAAFMGLIP